MFGFVISVSVKFVCFVCLFEMSRLSAFSTMILEYLFKFKFLMIVGI